MRKVGFNFIPTQTPQSYSFDTIIIGKDESYTFYEATTESFSTFAITGIKSMSADKSAAAELSRFKEEVAATPKVTRAEKVPPVRLIIISVVIVLLAIAIILYIRK